MSIHLSRSASRGLSEFFPTAVDLAADAAWQVHEFERDGVCCARLRH